MDFFVFEQNGSLTPVLEFALEREQRRLLLVRPTVARAEFRVVQASGVRDLRRSSETEPQSGIVIVLRLDSDAEAGLNLLRHRRVVDRSRAIFATGTDLSRDVEWVFREAGVSSCSFGRLADSAQELARWWVATVLRDNSLRYATL